MSDQQRNQLSLISEERDDEWILISDVEHYSYCPRQCGIRLVEQTFEENIYTIRGTQAHHRVDEATQEHRDGVRIVRAMPLWSRNLGLTGRADVVEFHDGVPYPVEYKIGKKRDWVHEAAQVCAQAMCLEEMLGCEVPRGAVYYIASKVRREIEIDQKLKETVKDMIKAIQVMAFTLVLPPAVADQRCSACSLQEVCLPFVVAHSDVSPTKKAIKTAKQIRIYQSQIFDPELSFETRDEVITIHKKGQMQ